MAARSRGAIFVTASRRLGAFSAGALGVSAAPTGSGTNAAMRASSIALGNAPRDKCSLVVTYGSFEIWEANVRCLLLDNAHKGTVGREYTKKSPRFSPSKLGDLFELGQALGRNRPID